MKRNYLPVILAAALMVVSLQACSNRPQAKKYEDYINDSLVLYNAEGYQKSIEAAQSALQLQPNSAIAYNNICAAYNQLKQWDRAVEACQKALAIQPDYERAKNNSLLAAQGAGLMPLKSYEEYINDSLAFYNAGDYQRSLEAAQSALQLQPNSAIAYNNICAAYNQLKQWDWAVEACQKALAIQLDFELAKNNLRVAQERRLQ